MRLEPGDRRYFCLPVYDFYCNNDKYFQPLIDGQTNPQFLEEIFLYLANFDISDFKCQRPPMTAYKKEMIETQLPDIYQFMNDVVNNETTLHFEDDELEKVVNASEFYKTTYMNWCGSMGVRNVKLGEFKNLLEEKFGLVVKQTKISALNVKAYKIIKEDIRKASVVV
jgi:hypothetical protein